MVAAGLDSLYHNSGAFGFPRGVVTKSVGWVGPDDPTLRPAALPLVRRVAEPYAANLAAAAVRACREQALGRVWLMPKSHWAFELDHANGAWMPSMLRSIQVDPVALAGRNDGSAIAFAPAEDALLAAALEELLTRLWGSDFALAWPGRPIVCTVHHHTQLWWTSSDVAFIDALDQVVPPSPAR